MITWLIEHVLPHAPTIPQACERANQFFRENKLESFTPRELERYVRSASHKFEQQFFSEIFNKLSAGTTNLIDSLLISDVTSIEDEEINEYFRYQATPSQKRYTRC